MIVSTRRWTVSKKKQVQFTKRNETKGERNETKGERNRRHLARTSIRCMQVSQVGRGSPVVPRKCSQRACKYLYRRSVRKVWSTRALLEIPLLFSNPIHVPAIHTYATGVGKKRPKEEKKRKYVKEADVYLARMKIYHVHRTFRST